jgi:uncharacterized lipoprotein YbaY
VRRPQVQGARGGAVWMDRKVSKPVTIRGVVRTQGASGVCKAVAIVRLLDVSRADAPSHVLAETSVAADEATNFPFELLVESPPDPRGNYTLWARVRGTDRATGQARTFGTTESYPWIPDGAPSVDHELIAHPW